MADKVFKKYYSRVMREGVLKALLLGLAIGFSVLALSSAVSWFFGFGAGLYVSLALFAVAVAVASPLLYFCKFRPTTKAIAKRVDELGLEERLITMTELENDDSYLAMKQREDALQALGKVDHMLLKIAISASLAVALCIAALVGAGAFTVDALYHTGVIPSGMSLLSREEIREYTLTYTAGEGGAVYYYDTVATNPQLFEGSLIVEAGEDGRAVIAKEAEGWSFTKWSDGVEDRVRIDKEVSRNVNVVAIFEKVGDADEEEKDIGLTGPGQYDSNAEPGSGSSGSDSGLPPTGEPSAGGGRDSKDQQVWNNETFIGDRLGNARSEANERLNSDESLTEGEKNGVSDYYGAIGGGDRGSGSDSGSSGGSSGDSNIGESGD